MKCKNTTKSKSAWEGGGREGKGKGAFFSLLITFGFPLCSQSFFFFFKKKKKKKKKKTWIFLYWCRHLRMSSTIYPHELTLDSGCESLDLCIESVAAMCRSRDLLRLLPFSLCCIDNRLRTCLGNLGSVLNVGQSLFLYYSRIDVSCPEPLRATFFYMKNPLPGKASLEVSNTAVLLSCRKGGLFVGYGF